MNQVKRTTELPSIHIDGVKYSKVAQRIKFLADGFRYSIVTEEEFIESLNSWKVKATLRIEDESGFQTYTGTAIEEIGNSNINVTSALENAETSAVVS